MYLFDKNNFRLYGFRWDMMTASVGGTSTWMADFSGGHSPPTVLL